MALNNNHALTAEEQALLTPDRIIEILKQGNDDFYNNRLTVKNTMERAREVVHGQFPMALILSCLDSRVPVEDIFHCGLGDLLVGRMAGAIANADMIGGMEYVCTTLRTKLIVVLGHENCGAIRMAIDDFELGNFTGLLNRIKPTVNKCKINYTGETPSTNTEFVDLVCRATIKQMVQDIRKSSLILKELEEKGELKIIGAYYNLHSGQVEFFNDSSDTT